MTPTSANVSAYIGICKEQARLALLRKCGGDMLGAVSLDEAREGLNRAAALSLETGAQTSHSAAECASEWVEALGDGRPLDYLRTGFAALDNTLMVTPGNVGSVTEPVDSHFTM